MKKKTKLPQTIPKIVKRRGGQQYILMKAFSKPEREAINTFFIRHNERGEGSNRGYVAYYAALHPPDGRPLVDRIICAAKVTPLHTPQAAAFFAGNSDVKIWKHVYVLQRLAALHPPKNLLSQFWSWCLRDLGRDPKIHLVATYADSGCFDARTGKSHSGGIYRASNAVFCGWTTPANKIEGFWLNGKRYSMRQGRRTLTQKDIPPHARIIRSSRKARYCWVVGPPLKRSLRHWQLVERMKKFKFESVEQPMLPGFLSQLGALLKLFLSWEWRKGVGW